MALRPTSNRLPTSSGSTAPSGPKTRRARTAICPTISRAPLEFQVANIEDSTFPVVPETGPPTSLPADQLILQPRTSYARHQFSGINLFALEMFDQFRTDLGLYATDGLLPDPFGAYNGQKNAVDGAVTQAQTSTAQVSVFRNHQRWTASGRRSGPESCWSQSPFGSEFSPRVPGFPGARCSRERSMGIRRNQC